MIEITKTAITDVFIITPRIYRDERGEFLETYRVNEFISVGIDLPFVQENHAGSQHGILRGLHYQIRQAQGKLIRVITGKIFDVAVDMRRSSETFGKSVGILLDDEYKRQLWIPPGFAHGYYVLSEWAEVSYKVTDYYAPEWERTLLWNDPDLKIDWPLIDGKTPILSENDLRGIIFKKADTYE